MANTWALCALWVGLALAATLLAIWFKISTALSEIVVGTVAQLVIGVFLTGLFGFAQGGLAGNTQWITFLAGTGAIAVSYTHLDVYKRQCICGRTRTTGADTSGG